VPGYLWSWYLEVALVMPIWQMITGEYPPQGGGVSDYSRLVAGALAAAGDEIDVWAPGTFRAQLRDVGATVHRLSDHFGPRGLATLSRELKPDGRILVQYVPHAFGARAMNLAFPFWLFSQRNKMPIDVMFHEVVFPIKVRQALRHNFLGVITRIMALMVARAATRTFVAIPAWERTLLPLIHGSRQFNWLPVPSNIPLAQCDERVRALKNRYSSTQQGILIGHFGTYGGWISEALKSSVLPILQRHSDASLLLIGGKSEGFRSQLLSEHPTLGTRIHATGEIDPLEVSRHITCCDLMVQPYPDGISGRRGSAMAALSHGRAIVTTSGHLTEPLWEQSGAVELVKAGHAEGLIAATSRLMEDAHQRSQLGTAAEKLYAERFDLTHTIAALRAGS
jgi:Glycosyl transferases group 1